MKTIASRVAAGAAWLDEHIPDWPERVTLPEFDISSSCACVLGQVFAPEHRTGWTKNVSSSGYMWGLDMVVAPDIADGTSEGADVQTWAEHHGFDSYDDQDDYEQLQQEWRTLIADRQGINP